MSSQTPVGTREKTAHFLVEKLQKIRTVNKILTKVKGQMIKIAYNYYKKHICKVKKMIVYSKPLKNNFNSKFEIQSYVFAAAFSGNLKATESDGLESKHTRTIDCEGLQSIMKSHDISIIKSKESKTPPLPPSINTPVIRSRNHKPSVSHSGGSFLRRSDH